MLVEFDCRAIDVFHHVNDAEPMSQEPTDYRDRDGRRDLMTVPERFEDGFDIKTVAGALFVGLVMLPGSIYLGLMAVQGGRRSRAARRRAGCRA